MYSIFKTGTYITLNVGYFIASTMYLSFDKSFCCCCFNKTTLILSISTPSTTLEKTREDIFNKFLHIYTLESYRNDKPFLFLLFKEIPLSLELAFLQFRGIHYEITTFTLLFSSSSSTSGRSHEMMMILRY